MGWKILLPQDIRPEGKNYLRNHGHTLMEGTGTDMLKLMKDIKDADAVITGSAQIGREVIRAAKHLKAVACLGIGYDLVDLGAAGEMGITVVNCPDANAISAVETTIFYMLYCSRQYTVVRRDFIDDYEKAKSSENKQELWDKTLGIIGCGRIGSRVAEICQNSFHMKVMAYDPYKPAAEFPEGVRVVRNMDELLLESDFVSLHMAPRRGARYQFGMEQFRKMKPTAWLINTVCGYAVNEKDLMEACKNHMIAGAALDGIEQMPVDKRNPLLYMDNILISPNIGSATREAQTRVSLQAAMGIQEVYEGRMPTFEMKEPDWDSRRIYSDMRGWSRNR